MGVHELPPIEVQTGSHGLQSRLSVAPGAKVAMSLLRAYKTFR
eukprot:SAG31_NODE_13778_length_847_cov_1.393048_1_plen_42_part_10